MAELQYRYPGLEPFSTHQEALFFGRSADRDALYELVELHQQVLLYAKSGLGKSSLINAGLVPKLLQENAKRSQGVHIIPVRIGAWVNAQSTSPLEAVLEALKTAPPLSGGLPEQPFYLERIVSDESSLWWRFKEDAARHAANPVYYLLFDQFEELFSHPEADVYAFKMQLADLLYRVVPQHLRFILEMKQGQNPDILSPDELHDLYEPLRIKVLYAIREDRYSELNQLTDMLPDFFQHRFQLDALGRAQAREAVVAPAALAGDFLTEPFEYAPDALAKILDYLTSSTQKTVETTQLQILCSHIERLRKPLVTIDDVPEFDNIFLQFYLDSMAELDEGLRDRAREFIEDYMIIDGHRIAHHRLACLEWMPMSAIDILLKERHLFRAERSSTGETLEIAHDTLVAPILIAKKQREADLEQMARAEAIAYELEERERTEKAQREAVEREAAEARREAAMAKLEAEAARLLADSNDRLRELERQKLNAQLEREQLERENQEKLLAKEQAAREKDQRQLLRSRIFLGIAMVAVFAAIGLGAWAYRLFKDAKLSEIAATESENKAARELLMKKKLTEAFYFYEDSLALASNGDLFGYVDKEGNSVIGYQFNEANNFQDPGYAIVHDVSEILVVDLDGHQYRLATRPEEIVEGIEAIAIDYLPYTIAKAKVFKNPQIRMLEVSAFDYQGRQGTGMNMPEVWGMKNLAILRLESCSLNAISPEIGMMDSLRRLSLEDNALMQMPSEIGNLKHLTYLNLAKNQIDSIPLSISGLTVLRVLDLSSNKIRTLPTTIKSLRRLRQLRMDENLLSMIPASIGNLKDLTRISMKENQIMTIAPELGLLSNLEYLDLTGNQISELPPSISNLHNLRTLNLANNNCQTIQVEFLNLGQLRELDLSQNRLEMLPDDICKLPNLINLQAAENSIAAFPADIKKLILLQTLNLDSNQLETIPPDIGGLRSLTVLNLNRNRLTTLPPEIGKLSNLKSLNVTQNQLTSIPPEIGKLSALRSLNLGITSFTLLNDEPYVQKNRLTAIPAELGKLKQLKHLGLAGNQLKSLPEELGNLSSLILLDLTENALHELPPAICKLSSLTTLKLEGNQLSTLPPCISQLNSLRFLVLNRNQFQSLPPDIAKCKNLERLFLKGNPCAASEKDRKAIRKQVAEWLPNCTVFF